MSNQQSSTAAASGGIGTCSLLGVAFVVLKLCGVINWPWWWVTCPFWIPFAIAAAVLLVAFFVLVIVHGTTGRKL